MEECTLENLRARELHYIKILNPFYNYIGKARTEIEKNKISLGIKKWWETLDESTKNKIIKNNLKGPFKGHSVSAETRKKISKKIAEVQGVPVMIVETGQRFEKVKFLEEYLGACTGTCAAYFKGKIKSVKGYNVVKCRD